MSSQRIFVRGLTAGTSAADLETLIAKICKVQEVHVAEGRDFAIVSLVSGDPEQANKCIRAFSGSSWKGAKLKLERAKNEFYKDRLERERAETASAEAEAERAEAEGGVTEAEDVDTDMEMDVVKEKKPYLRIRKIAGAGLLNVSTYPKMVLPALQSVPPRRGVMSCGSKRIFDHSNDDEYREVSNTMTVRCKESAVPQPLFGFCLAAARCSAGAPLLSPGTWLLLRRAGARLSAAVWPLIFSLQLLRYCSAFARLPLSCAQRCALYSMLCALCFFAL
jgi:hypothetical protein